MKKFQATLTTSDTKIKKDALVKELFQFPCPVYVAVHEVVHMKAVTEWSKEDDT